MPSADMVDHVRFTPNNGHTIADVRFFADFVRFTPESGHYSGTPICPLLTHNGHSGLHRHPVPSPVNFRPCCLGEEASRMAKKRDQRRLAAIWPPTYSVINRSCARTRPERWSSSSRSGMRFYPPLLRFAFAHREITIFGVVAGAAIGSSQ